jgi:hypothetical protein
LQLDEHCLYASLEGAANIVGQYTAAVDVPQARDRVSATDK